MKKLIANALLALLVSYASFAQQYSAADQLALKIPEPETRSTAGISAYVNANFTSDSAKARALFVWVASNISYDVAKVKNISQLTEKASIESVLKTRLAVCQGYAELLAELFTKSNIPVELVPGFAKLPDGTITRLSHEWLAAQINNKWWLFDPTWAAGSVDNSGRFTKHFSNTYYKVSPEEMIAHHMPFDPMHQFLHYPITANDFYDGKTTINNKGNYFSFSDTLRIYNTLSLIEKTRQSTRRIQANGVRTDLINQYIQHMNRNLQSFDSYTGLEGASNHYKQAIEVFNRYIDHKNHQFASIKGQAIQQLMDTVSQHVMEARALLAAVDAKDAQQQKYLYEIKNSLYQFSLRVDEENAFLKKYLSKG